ncbi:TIGR02302 family protein [Kaistia algarum]|nr:TIGR02302 family protein [Kaistia algarum]
MTEPAGETSLSGSDGERAMPHPAETQARRRIDAATDRARLVLLFERFWPRLVPIFCVIGLFLILSWFGLWSRLPDLARFGLLGFFGTVLLFLVIRLGGIAMPSADEALARIARESPEPHRPAVAFGDKLPPTEDPLTLALWRAHRRRLVESLRVVRAGWPSPGMNARDPYALRFLVPLLLFMTFLSAGADRAVRLSDALRPTLPVAEAAARIDAWVTPPTYTGQPPIFLTGDAARAPNEGSAIRVPFGSVVTVRISDDADLSVTAENATGGSVPFEAAAPLATKDGTAAMTLGEHRVVLRSDSKVAVNRRGGPLLAWNFAVTPDQPPKIELTREPGATLSGALQLSYTVSDDYGVLSAKAVIAKAEGPGNDAARPLVAPPELPLNLPRLRMREGTGETIRDLSAHPWAGAKVRMSLEATDEAGQTGSSAPVDFTLPVRQFTNPLAKAVVEQRRNLALDANRAGYVATALDAITMDPSKFDSDGVYLSLRAAYHRITGARDDDDLRSVVDFLWEIALGIEDGDLSLAAQDLRAAQEALKQAIENGASDAELDKAMKDLRAAMDKYLQALAENAQKNPSASPQPMDKNARVMSQQDLEKMLDQIENLAKTGSREAAQQMLSELQQMMENMEAGRQQAQQGDGGEMSQALDKLGQMIRRQQQLMDQTFKMDPDTDGSGPPPPEMTPEERQKQMDALRQGQQDLSKMLEDLQKQMQGQGMQPDGKLGQAGRAMGEATDQLGRGQPGQAVGPQGQALQALRDGAKGLAERMARQGSTGTRQGGTMPGQDPLGRQQVGRGNDLGSSVKVPDAIDTQRAREILDAIRRRLGDAARPLIERDYLERLLQRY